MHTCMWVLSLPTGLCDARMGAGRQVGRQQLAARSPTRQLGRPRAGSGALRSAVTVIAGHV